MWGPTVIPYLSPSPTGTPRRRPSPPRARLLRVARTLRIASGLYNPPPHPLDSSSETLAATKPLCATARETLASPPLETTAPSLFCCREVAWELRQDEWKPPVPRVCVADPYITEKPSLEIHRLRRPPLSRAPLSLSVSRR
jgi:hypothetical protein